ncbi:PREDICTED: 28S ribosomal protein S31, mitochondrial-like isoform X2 [Priapulus caudatus]|uniref:Small ribosomal subunit protein mS31 n=1 Tax=Priapulus caudatus TaxID=37621 RepID=A0ABM1E388_PRICU|nr:PREDICTED: 28S ribosomal protein S31, mitochondrial-like isoform X2 [Priapulus caudatus]
MSAPFTRCVLQSKFNLIDVIQANRVFQAVVVNHTTRERHVHATTRAFSSKDGEDKKYSSDPSTNQENIDGKKSKSDLADLLGSMKVTTNTDGTGASEQKPSKKLKLAHPPPKTKAARMEAGVFTEKKHEPSNLKDVKDWILEPQLLSAVRKVAESLPGDTQNTESELITKLRDHSAATAGAKSDVNLSSLFVGMKIDREAPKRRSRQPSRDDVTDRPDAERRPGFGRSLVPTRPTRKLYPKVEERKEIDLFGASPLNIFKVPETPEERVSEEWDIWEEYNNRALKDAVTYSPANAFVEQIQWTECGKLWPFPIDNQIGLEEEENVGFHEHVFLDHLLADFPKRGPVRHFMELVINGLSKNPYMTVAEKREHVDWFRRYFEAKEEVIHSAIEVA